MVSKKASTKKPEPWGKSEAKKHLSSLLQNDTNGIAGMDVEDVHKLSTLFQPYNMKRFTGYLTTLKNGLAKKKKAPTEKPPTTKATPTPSAAMLTSTRTYSGYNRFIEHAMKRPDLSPEVLSAFLNRLV